MSAMHRHITTAHGQPWKRLVVVIVAIMGLVGAAGGVAYAYWTSHGSGSGSGTTGTMTINVTGLVGDDTNQTTLIPGGTGDVILRVTNPNSFPVHVTSITSNGSATASPVCTPTGVTFNAPSDYTPAQFTLSPGSSLIRLGGASSMSTASASGCQGSTFSMPLSVTVQK